MSMPKMESEVTPSKSKTALFPLVYLSERHRGHPGKQEHNCTAAYKSSLTALNYAQSLQVCPRGFSSLTSYLSTPIPTPTHSWLIPPGGLKHRLHLLSSCPSLASRNQEIFLNHNTDLSQTLQFLLELLITLGLSWSPNPCSAQSPPQTAALCFSLTNPFTILS